jgi:O-antigen/teichoic acid export membrane protein
VIQKRILYAAIANWTSQFFSLAIGFLVAPFVLHHLGESQYGILVLVGSVIAQGANLDFGIRPALIKYVAAHQARGEVRELRAFIATALWLYCCLASVALVLTLIVSPFIPVLFNVPSSESDTITTLGLLMGAQLAFSIPSSTPSAILAGLQRYDIINAISVIWAILTAIATVAVLLAGGGVVAIAIATAAIAVLMALVYVVCLKRIAPDLQLTFRGARRELVRTILSFSTSMLVMNTSNGLQAQSGEMVLGAFLPVSLVSPYTLARRLSNIPQLIAERFLWSFVPLSSELDAQGKVEHLQRMYLTGTRIVLAISLPFAAAIMVLAGPFLSLWIGASYAKYAPIAVLLTAAGTMEIACRVGGTILQGLGRHHRLAVISVCGLVANFALSTSLVRPFGPVGVALGTLLPTVFIIFVWRLSYSLRTLEISLRSLLKQGFLPVLLPFILESGLLLALKSTFELSNLLTVGCAAAAGIGLFSIVYLYFFSGESERQLVQTAVTVARNLASRKVVPRRSSTSHILL